MRCLQSSCNYQFPDSPHIHRRNRTLWLQPQQSSDHKRYKDVQLSIWYCQMKEWWHPTAVMIGRTLMPMSSSIPRQILLTILLTLRWATHTQQQVEDGGFTNLLPLDDSSLARKATNGSLPSPTLFNDEMMLYTSPNSSFHSYQRQGHSLARIIFGESGKPITPLTAFGHCTPTTTVL